MIKLILFISCFTSTIFAGSTYIVSGSIKDKETEKSLPNINISVLKTELGTVSDSYGNFKIELEKGIYQIQFSMIGYKPTIIDIVLRENQSDISILLESSILEFNAIEVQGIFSSRLGYESVDVVNGKDIKLLQKSSVADILRTLPGVDVQFAHPNGRNVNVSIRGSSDYKPGGYNNRVLVLLDGFPIQIPNSGAPDWSALPLENIARIEIDNSPASAQYGHNSMGGVINLITNQNFSENNGNINTGVKSNKTGQFGFNYNKKNGNWTYGIVGMTRQSDGHRFNSDDKTRRLNSYLGFLDNKGRTYRLNLLLAKSDIGHPGFDISPSFRRSNRQSNYIQMNIFYPLSPGMSISNSLYLNTFYTRYYDRDDTPNGDKESDQNYRDYSIGLRSELLLTKWAGWILMIGGDFGLDQSNVSILNPIYNHPQQITMGSFIQSKYSIGSGWTIGMGLRYDYRQVIPGNGYNNRVFQKVTPKANLVYSLKGRRTFTLSFSEGFRAPSLSELYLQHTSSYGLTMQGNPSIKPEHVSAFEIMYAHSHSQQFSWSTSLFHNRYQDMIDFIYSLPVLAVNRGGVIGTGGEFQSMWKPIKSISIYSEYAFLQMENRNGDPILYRSKHRGKLRINLKQGTYNFTSQVQLWSRQKYDDFLSHDYKIINNKIVFPIKELPGQFIVNLSIGKKIKSFQSNLTISNIFNQEYKLIQNYPMPGRTWKVTFTKSF